MRKNYFINFFIIFLPLLIFTGCLGLEEESSSTRAVTISGTVNGVATTSSSLSALGFKNALSNTGLSGESFTILDNGEVVGSGETGSNGDYSVSIDYATLNPNNDPSLTKTLVLETESGITNLVQATISSGGTITLSATPDSTLGMEAVKNKIKEENSFSDWENFDLSSASLNFDVTCLKKMEEKKWELVDTDDTGLGGQMGTMKEMMLSQLSSKDFGSYQNFGEMAQAFMDGTADSTFQSTAATNAAVFTGKSADSYSSKIGDAMTSFGTMVDSFATNFAGGAGAGVSTLAMKGGVDATSDSLCALLESDADVLKEVLEILLNSTGSDEFKSLFSSKEGILIVKGLIEQFKKEDGTFSFAEKWDPKAAIGLMSGCSDDLSKCDISQMKGLLNNLPSGSLDLRDWGKTVMATCVDKASSCADATGLQNIAGWGAGQILSGFEPPSNPADFNFGKAFESRSTTTDFTKCVGDPTLCQNVSKGCQANADCPSGQTCNTTNSVCSAPTTTTTTTTTNTTGTTTTTTTTQTAINLCGTWSGAMQTLGTGFTLSAASGSTCGGQTSSYTGPQGMMTLTVGVTGGTTCSTLIGRMTSDNTLAQTCTLTTCSSTSLVGSCQAPGGGQASSITYSK